MHRARGSLVAVLVLVASAPLAAAQEGTVRLARVEPRFEPPVLERLPEPLSSADVARYRRIFALQEQGRMREADRLVAELGNDLLMGHVLAERYLHPTAWRSRCGELRAWLERYADHPQADRIHGLARRRCPEGTALPAPVRGYLGGTGVDFDEPDLGDVLDAVELTAGERSWLGQIAGHVTRGRIRAARELLERPPRGAGALAADIGRWLVARGALTEGADAAAFALARPAARRSGEEVPTLHWTAGLAAWRLGRFAEAAESFAALAAHDSVRGERRARAALWGARAFMVSGRPEAAARLLHLAARASDEFYGLIARAVLGERLDLHFEAADDGEARSLLVRFPGSRRALALAQVGRLDLAEAEIRKLAARAGPRLLTALALLAERLHLPAAQLRVAERLRLVDGRAHHGVLYPLFGLAPEDGYRLDRAVLWAFARAESGFDADAQSPRGAVGLMQLTPHTARLVADRLGADRPSVADLRDPAVNLTLGQAYLLHLLEDPLAGRSLVHLALAWNAGPDRLRRWDASVLSRFRHDPLLYIESVPVRESRAFVKKVLTGLWAYRIRLGQDIPSLVALAENRWPVYVPLEQPSEVVDARADR